MLVKVKSAALNGIDAIPVVVEVDVSRGLPSFTTVGLPDSSVRESKDRVKAAIRNCGYEFPTRKVTVNLAPADLRKEGPSFDLPIALGLLATTGIIAADSLAEYLAVGELSLDGSLLPVSGTLSIILTAAAEGYKGVIIPRQNGQEALLAGRIEIIAEDKLVHLVEIFNGLRQAEPVVQEKSASVPQEHEIDFKDIRGLKSVKRALEVAAAGMHNLIMEGTPGSGKTMLAKSIPSIMADWTIEERLETAKIYSAYTQNKKTELIPNRPFRAPHHTVSYAGLIGGGTYPRPGEVSLAHNGVLFLDELPEFRKHVLEVLRQPLEEGRVTISRAQASLTYPSRFMLVAAMNPCPCGYHGSVAHPCECDEQHIRRYKAKISGPLLDRVDMHMTVNTPGLGLENKMDISLTSAQVRERVNLASKRQALRFNSAPSLYVNSQMGVREIAKYCKIGLESEQLLNQSAEVLGLSIRGCHRVIKVARTIADLAGETHIQPSHVAEAVFYRKFTYPK